MYQIHPTFVDKLVDGFAGFSEDVLFRTGQHQHHGGRLSALHQEHLKLRTNRTINMINMRRAMISPPGAPQTTNKQNNKHDKHGASYDISTSSTSNYEQTER